MNKAREGEVRKLLVKELEKAIFSNGSVIIGTWHSIVLTFTDGHGLYECIKPKRGNMRVRIPKGKYNDGTIKYELYRVTNEKDLVHVDTIRAERPEFTDRTKIKHHVNLNVLK